MEAKLSATTRSRTTERAISLSALVSALCITLIGCAKPERASPLQCRVLIDGAPALEVRLVLMRIDQGAPKPLLEGIADSGGTIAMKLVQGADSPGHEELELSAMIESRNGDWQLNAPWSDPKKTPLKVKWSMSTERLDIPLPKKAIRSI